MKLEKKSFLLNKKAKKFKFKKQNLKLQFVIKKEEDATGISIAVLRCPTRAFHQLKKTLYFIFLKLNSMNLIKKLN